MFSKICFFADSIEFTKKREKEEFEGKIVLSDQRKYTIKQTKIKNLFSF